MNSQQVVTKARDAKKNFGVKCDKFSGAVIVEILKAALTDEGIITSPRDVFIRKIPLEIDLLVPRKGQEPFLGLLYEPEQVIAALEVKSSGPRGEAALDKISHNFGLLHNAGIRCAYVTIEEQRSYRWAASSDRVDFPCFTLAWYKVWGGPIEPTKDWSTLVDFLRDCISTSHVR